MDPLVPTDPTQPDDTHDLGIDRNGWLPITMAATWLLLVAFGLCILMMYANRPGQSGRLAVSWPTAIESRHSTSKSTLLVFAHPRCPCTHATIDELAWVMTRCADQVECQVLFVHPKGKSLEWVQDDLWRKASSISGVNVCTDGDGQLAKVFGAQTSGHVMMYDTSGRLRFEGGITPSRGHRGSNVGRQQLVNLTNEGQRLTATTVWVESSQKSRVSIDSTCVFGCPLFSMRSSSTLDHAVTEDPR